jgi:trafficking protein particle complex subunit 8
VRTASDQPYRLQMFKIRMVYASNVQKQDYEVILES